MPRAADLCAQLPRASRLLVEIDPANAWDERMWLLSGIEHSLRVLVWHNTKDGQRGINPPAPIRPRSKAGPAPRPTGGGRRHYTSGALMEMLGKEREDAD